MIPRPDDIAALASATACVAGGGQGAGDEPPRDLSRHSDLADVQSFIDLLDSAWAKRSPNRPTPDSDGEAVTADMHFGRFVLRELVGEGGFGMVFRADDPELKRSVALKLPKPNVMISAELRARFIREAQSAAALDHENIVKVHETGHVGSIGFIASAFCDGPTLAEWLREEGARAPWRVAADIVRQLAGAVHHAHQRGILHRDLKPSNVLMKPPDEPGGAYAALLTDFGLAKQLAESADVTQTRTRAGTTRYMAPEQLVGDRGDVTISADVYSLGVILYELLTGAPPFDAESEQEIARRTCEDEPSPIRVNRRDVPRDLETVCLKCLEKEPAGRYGSARELADDLQRCLEGKEVRARPLGRVRRLYRKWRRQPLVAALTGLLLLSLMVGAAGVVGQWRRAVARAEQIERSLIEAEQDLVNWAWVRDETLYDPNLNDPVSIEARRRLREHYRRLLGLHRVAAPSPAFEATARSYEARIAELEDELDLAAERYRESIEIWRRLVRQDAEDPRYTRGLAENLYCYGLLRRFQDVPDDPLYRLNGDDAHFASLLAEDGGAGQVCAEYARLLGERAEALEQLGIKVRAYTACSASWELWGRLHVNFPDVREYKYQNTRAAFLRYVLTDERKRAARKPETLAIPELMARELCHDEPENVEYRLLYSQIVRYMATAARDHHDVLEAVRLYEVAAVSLRGMWQRPPPDTAVSNLLASVLRNLAELYDGAGNWDATLRATEEAITVSEQAIKHNSISRENSAALGFLHKKLGELLRRDGHLIEAQRAFINACGALEETLIKSGDQRRYRPALTECRAALAELETTIPSLSNSRE